MGHRCGHALRFPSIPAVPVPHGCRDLAKAGTRKRPTRGANIPANPAMTHSRGAASLLRARERSSEGGPRGPSRLRSRMSDRSCGGSLRQGREVSAWVPGERTRRQCRLVVDLPSVEHYVRVQTEVNLRGVAEPVARLRDRHSATVPQRGAAMAEIVRRECRHPRRLTRPPERCPERVRVEACEHLTVEITVARSRLRDRIEELSRDRNPSALPCFCPGARHAPAAVSFIDVPPAERLELAYPHPGRVEHEHGETVGGGYRRECASTCAAVGGLTSSVSSGRELDRGVARGVRRDLGEVEHLGER
jgi:hypothetical protein